MRVLVAVALRRIDAEEGLAVRRIGGSAEGDHVRPDLVQVEGVREVDHVGIVAARCTNVDLQAHVVALLAKPLLVGGQAEELHVDKAVPDAKGLDGRAGQLAERGVDSRAGVVPHVEHVLHRGSDVDGILRLVLKERLAVGVDDGLIGADVARDKLLQHVGLVPLGGKQCLEGRCIGYFGRATSAHATLGLGKERIADLLGKRANLRGIVEKHLPRGGNARRSVERLHLGLALPLGHLRRACARSDVEVVAQTGILAEPVLVLRLEPVDLAVLPGEECDRTEDLVVVLQGGHPIVLVERVLDLLRHHVVGRVADAEHRGAVLAQAVAPVPVGVGELRRDEDDVHGASFREGRGDVFHGSAR